MKKSLTILLGTYAAGFFVFSGDCGVLYDPAADFTLNANPNGVWSYGYSITLGGALTLHQDTDADWRGTGIYARFTSVGNGLGVYYNPTDTTVTYSGPSDLLVWGPHALSLHPGEQGQLSILRFTAPTDGFFQAQGQWYSVDQYYGASTDVHILKNGVAVFNDTMLGKTDTSNFDSSLQLAPGDTLDFVVGPYLYGHGWDSTGLSLALVITPIPEPSVVALLLLSLVCWRRR